MNPTVPTHNEEMHLILDFCLYLSFISSKWNINCTIIVPVAPRDLPWPYNFW
jgi:hypothetical protein